MKIATASSEPLPAPPGASPGGPPVFRPPGVTARRGSAIRADSPPEKPDVPPSIPAPSNGATAASVALLLVVIALVTLMMTGYNDQIPGLQPASSRSVEVAGDRTSTTYLFVNNGTLLNATRGVQCPECPFVVAPLPTFTYDLTLSDPFNRSVETRTPSTIPPFHLETLRPPLPISVAPGLAVEVQLTMIAPPDGVTVIIPLELSADVG